MAASSEYVEFLLDQLSRWGGVSARRLFGGAGLFRDGLMFGLFPPNECENYFRNSGYHQPSRE